MGYLSPPTYDLSCVALSFRTGGDEGTTVPL